MLYSELIKKIETLTPVDRQDLRVILLWIYITQQPPSDQVKMEVFSKFIADFQNGIHSQKIINSLDEPGAIGDLFRELFGIAKITSTKTLQPKSESTPAAAAPATETKLETKAESTQAGDAKNQSRDVKELARQYINFSITQLIQAMKFQSFSVEDDQVNFKVTIKSSDFKKLGIINQSVLQGYDFARDNGFSDTIQKVLPFRGDLPFKMQHEPDSDVLHLIFEKRYVESFIQLQLLSEEHFRYCLEGMNFKFRHEIETHIDIFHPERNIYRLKFPTITQDDLPGLKLPILGFHISETEKGLMLDYPRSAVNRFFQENVQLLLKSCYVAFDIRQTSPKYQEITHIMIRFLAKDLVQVARTSNLMKKPRLVYPYSSGSVNDEKQRELNKLYTGQCLMIQTAISETKWIKADVRELDKFPLTLTDLDQFLKDLQNTMAVAYFNVEKDKGFGPGDAKSQTRQQVLELPKKELHVADKKRLEQASVQNILQHALQKAKCEFYSPKLDQILENYAKENKVDKPKVINTDQDWVGFRLAEGDSEARFKAELKKYGFPVDKPRLYTTSVMPTQNLVRLLDEPLELPPDSHLVKHLQTMPAVSTTETAVKRLYTWVQNFAHLREFLSVARKEKQFAVPSQEEIAALVAFYQANIIKVTESRTNRNNSRLNMRLIFDNKNLNRLIQLLLQDQDITSDQKAFFASLHTEKFSIMPFVARHALLELFASRRLEDVGVIADYHGVMKNSDQQNFHAISLRAMPLTFPNTFPSYTLLIDTSGSMSGSRIEIVKEAAKKFSTDLLQTMDKCFFQCIVFGIAGRSGGVNIIVPMQAYTAGTLAQFHSAIDRISADGWDTPTGEAVIISAEELIKFRKNHPVSKIAPVRDKEIVFTDGDANGRDFNTAIEQRNRLLEEAKVSTPETSVFAVQASLGENTRNCLTKLARASGRQQTVIVTINTQEEVMTALEGERLASPVTGVSIHRVRVEDKNGAVEEFNKLSFSDKSLDRFLPIPATMDLATLKITCVMSEDKKLSQEVKFSTLDRAVVSEPMHKAVFEVALKRRTLNLIGLSSFEEKELNKVETWIAAQSKVSADYQEKFACEYLRGLLHDGSREKEKYPSLTAEEFKSSEEEQVEWYKAVLALNNISLLNKDQFRDELYILQMIAILCGKPSVYQQLKDLLSEERKPSQTHVLIKGRQSLEEARRATASGATKTQYIGRESTSGVVVNKDRLEELKEVEDDWIPCRALSSTGDVENFPMSARHPSRSNMTVIYWDWAKPGYRILEDCRTFFCLSTEDFLLLNNCYVQLDEGFKLSREHPDRIYQVTKDNPFIPAGIAIRAGIKLYRELPTRIVVLDNKPMEKVVSIVKSGLGLLSGPKESAVTTVVAPDAGLQERKAP